MASSSRIALRLASYGTSRNVSRPEPLTRFGRTASIHTTPPTLATVSSVHGAGPPPEPPQPAADSAEARLDRRKKQAALLQKAQDIRSAAVASDPQSSVAPLKSQPKSKSALLKKRFWQDVHVKEVDGALEVHLDARPLRRPNTKEIVRIPLSKPMLATALAIEWDMLTSVQQAGKHHLIPLTSLVCRALDIADDDAATTTGTSESIRAGIARTLMRYLDTDSLLCWAPPPRADDSPGKDGLSLRETQERAAEKVVSFLCSRVWPGVEIEPVLDGETIMPKGQKPGTRQIIEGWVMGLSSWELAGLERGVLAGKGLLGAARLLVEWSEGPVGVGGGQEGSRFDVEEAAKTASIEVDWQTGRWGEVEDTHDVEKEDIRRQFGSVVLLVSGTGMQ